MHKMFGKKTFFLLVHLEIFENKYERNKLLIQREKSNNLLTHVMSCPKFKFQVEI